MATNPTTDLTEEDAADLQFPKEYMQKSYSVRKTEFHCAANRPIDLENSLQKCDLCFNISRLCSCSKCAKCTVSLQVPFIECTQCANVSLCCRCFASGSELETHKSDHNYRVIKNDFILFDKSNWTAAEELTMLDTMYTCGYGNWELIAKKLGNRTVGEIKDHYNTFYIDNPVSDILPKVSETVQSLFPKPVVPFRYKLTDIDEPPRYEPHTLGYESVAGYNAARSDFESEYDTNAEELLALLSAKDIPVTDTHYDILTELQCCIVRSYNRRLRERQRRKNIIKAHGLILIRKTMSWLHRYDRTLTRKITERMLCFMQFVSGCEFDFIMEGLHHATELKQKLSRLCEYRRKGITSMKAAEVYESLKNQRDQHEKELTAFVSNPLFNWQKLMPVYVQPVNVTNKRSQYRPLDIIGLPGFEKLSVKEQELCSTVRLVPQTYFELKDLLVTENKKFGYLKLQTARKMLKIDVNKTRKLYDFLAKEGYIVKTAS